jgi:hypothetical protein
VQLPRSSPSPPAVHAAVASGPACALSACPSASHRPCAESGTKPVVTLETKIAPFAAKQPPGSIARSGLSGNSLRFGPSVFLALGNTQIESAVDQPDVSESLREIAQLLARFRVDLFG